MSKKLVLALALAGVAAACAPKQPEPMPTAPMVQPEPVFKGKYGAN